MWSSLVGSQRLDNTSLTEIAPRFASHSRVGYRACWFSKPKKFKMSPESDQISLACSHKHVSRPAVLPALPCPPQSVFPSGRFPNTPFERVHRPISVVVGRLSNKQLATPVSNLRYVSLAYIMSLYAAMSQALEGSRNTDNSTSTDMTFMIR